MAGYLKRSLWNKGTVLAVAETLASVKVASLALLARTNNKLRDVCMLYCLGSPTHWLICTAGIGKAIAREFLRLAAGALSFVSVCNCWQDIQVLDICYVRHVQVCVAMCMAWRCLLCFTQISQLFTVT